MAEKRSASEAQEDDREEPTGGAVTPAGDRPGLRRSQIVKAKKGQLVAWARAYGLNTSGKKADVRDRLLQYMDEFQVVEEPEAAPEAPPEPEPVAEPPPSEEPETVAPPEPEAAEEPEPVVEAIPEGEPAGPPEAEGVEPVAEPAPEELPAEDEAEELDEEDLEAELEAEELPPEVEEPVPEEPQEMAPLEPEVAETPPEAVAEPPPAPKPVIITAAPKPAPIPELMPAPVEALKPAPPVELDKALACPTCGKDLEFIAKYDRCYCWSCQKYAPKAFGKETPAPTPEPAPARPAVIAVPELKPAVPEVKPAPPPVERPPEPKVVPKGEHPCPTCGKELTFIKEWGRWYCRDERRYAPKDYGTPVRNPCPTCGKELRFIALYNRWYCHAEQRYAPKAYVAAAPTVMAPAAAPAVAVAPVRAGTAAGTATVAAPTAAVVTHAHGRPGGGVALAATGFALLLFVRLLTSLLPAMGVDLLAGMDPVVTTQVLPLLDFLGILLTMVGVVVGLLAIRTR